MILWLLIIKKILKIRKDLIINKNELQKMTGSILNSIEDQFNKYIRKNLIKGKEYIFRLNQSVSFIGTFLEYGYYFLFTL